MTSNSINFTKVRSQVIKQTQLYSKHDLGIRKNTLQKQFSKAKCCFATKGYVIITGFRKIKLIEPNISGTCDN